jgi:hypothetical protein
MIGFAARRLMELDIEGRTGAAHGERSPDRVERRVAASRRSGKSSEPAGRRGPARILGEDFQAAFVRQIQEARQAVADRGEIRRRSVNEGDSDQDRRPKHYREPAIDARRPGSKARPLVIFDTDFTRMAGTTCGQRRAKG